MEYSQNNKNKKANKGKLGPKGGLSKKQTNFQRKCFNYYKMGHKALEHRLSKQNGNRKDNVIENISKHVSGINFSAMVSVVHSNPIE